MATSSTFLQSVLLFQHHQTTTPYAPVPSAATRMAKESPVKEKEQEPEQQEEDEEDEEEDDGEEH